MKHFRLIILTLLCAVAGTAQAYTVTKTYIFDGKWATEQVSGGHFYEYNTPNVPHNGTPKTWDITQDIPSVSFTLEDGIAVTFESAAKRFIVEENRGHFVCFGAQGNVGISISSSTYFIYHVTFYDKMAHVAQLNSSNQQVDSGGTSWFDFENNQKSFSTTVNDGILFSMMEITYSDQDASKLIDTNTTTVSGIEASYNFNGSPVCPEPTVVCNGTTLTKDTDYSLSYINNETVGTASLIISGIDPYFGSIAVNYNIESASVLTGFTRLNDGSYQIASEDDLVRLSNYVNAGNDCSGITFQQTADIVCNGSINPIGNYGTSPFKGTYDGQNHVISGITIDKHLTYRKVDEENNTITFAAGLFGIVEGGTVRDVRLINPTIKNYGLLPPVATTPTNTSQSSRRRVHANPLTTPHPNPGNSLIMYYSNKTLNYYSGGVVGVATGATITNCFVYNPSFEDNGKNLTTGGAINAKSFTVSTDAIVGNSSLSSDIAKNFQVYQAKAGSNVSFATNSITESDGFIYDGNRYYKAGVTIAFNTSVSNPTVFIDGNGNNLTPSGSGTSYSLAMPARDITINAAQGITGLTLANGGSNSSAIATAAGNTGQLYTVTLDGRTLYKDGKWNTICLPFNLTIAGSPLAGAEARELSSASVIPFILNLDFSNPVDELVAGTPYIIKWESGTDNIVNPVFYGVTISNERHDATFSDIISFKGSYDNQTFTAADRSILFMGGNNTLYYPGDGASIGACRAYFQLLGGLTAGEPWTQLPLGIKEFVLNFGEDDATSLNEELRMKSEESAAAKGWYDLNGRKLSGKPSQKGIYINNGRKVIIH